MLVGEHEQTLVTLTTGGLRFDNGTRKTVPAAVLQIDTRHSRAGDKTGALTQTPVALKHGETNLTLRVLVDNSVIEAFAMGGRGSMIRRVYPKQFNSSVGAALVYNLPVADAQLQQAPPEPPLVTITAWEVSSGFDE